MKTKTRSLIAHLQKRSRRFPNWGKIKPVKWSKLPVNGGRFPKILPLWFLAGFLALSLWPDRWLWIWSGTFPLPVPVWYSLNSLAIKSVALAHWLF